MEEELLKLIRDSLVKDDMNSVVKYLITLNDIRVDTGRKELLPSDILFMNFDCLFPKIPKEYKHIYVAEYGKNFIKIGVSKNPLSRIKTLGKSNGRTLTRYIYSYSTENAFQLEKNMHEKFKTHRLNGEYFNCSFDECRDELKELVEIEKEGRMK